MIEATAGKIGIAQSLAAGRQNRHMIVVSLDMDNHLVAMIRFGQREINSPHRSLRKKNRGSAPPSQTIISFSSVSVPVFGRGPCFPDGFRGTVLAESLRTAISPAVAAIVRRASASADLGIIVPEPASNAPLNATAVSGGFLASENRIEITRFKSWRLGNRRAKTRRSPGRLPVSLRAIPRPEV